MKRGAKLFLSIGTFLFVSFSLAANKVNRVAKAEDEISSYVNSYVSDNLVSIYSGLYNTKSGHNSDSSKWENLAGTNYISVSKDTKNYFGDDAFHLNSSKQYFTNKELNAVNNSAFTLEFMISNLNSIGTTYNTLINSSNDNFALFRNVETDVLEFKFGGLAQNFRPTIIGSSGYLEDCLVSITYKVGGKVRIYINGHLKAEKTCDCGMAANDLYFGHSDQTRSFEADFKSFRIYKKELSSEEIKANAESDKVYDRADDTVRYAELKLGETNIVGGLNSIRRINNSDELNEVMALKTLPQTLILHVDETLKVVTDKGPSLSLEDAFKIIQGKVVPAFKVESNEAADKLVTFLKSNFYYDCFVMSQDSSIVKKVRTSIPNVYGVIDYTDSPEKKDFTMENLNDNIRSDMHKSFGTIALLSQSIFNREDFQDLFESIVNVWVDVPGDSELNLYNAALSGAIGVVTDKTETLHEFVSTKINANTMTRMPLNIGHRGLPAVAPENTIESARLAYENGANVIELDIYLTTDNRVVVMHDATTGRTCNEDLKVEECTLSQLRALYVNKGFENTEYNKCRIPTFDEYLKEFRGTDARLFVEIKSNKEDIVPKTKQLIDAYDMYSQVSFISFNSVQLANINKYYPGATTGLLINGILDEENSQEDMLQVMNNIGKNNSTLNPNYSGYGKKAMLAALSRGISVYPWTFNSASEYYSYFVNGYCGLTGNDCRIMGDLVRKIYVQQSGKAGIGEKCTFDVLTTKYNGNTDKAAPSNIKIEILKTDIDYDLYENEITFKSEGLMMLLVGYETNLTSKSSYTIYSNVLLIPVEKRKADVKHGCFGSALTSSILVSTLAGIGFIALFAKRKQK